MVDPSTTRAIVIDNGSGMIKAGVGGEEQPRCVFPSVVGRLMPGAVIPEAFKKDLYIGDEAQRFRGVLHVTYPIEHGIVTSWEDMTKIWEHTIVNEIRLEASECALMLTEAPQNPKANREQMISISFDTFQAKGFYVETPGVLAMFASGRTTGLIVDSGDGVTYTVPIFQTRSVPLAVKKIMLAGRDISTRLEYILHERGWNFETTAQFQIVHELKENMCYVTMNYKKDMDDSPTKEWKEQFEKPYTLPDGNVLTIGNERFRAPEIMFQPDLVGKDVPGVHKLTYNSIMDCDPDMRKALWENVVLSGGSTMFNNYPERLLQELKTLAPPTINVKVIAQPDRKYSVFVGAASLASFSSFQNSWITKQEYEENGAAIVHRKCL